MKKHIGEKVTRKHLRKVKKKWVVAATTAVALIGAGGFYADADQAENVQVESTKVHKEERIAADWQANTVKQVENEVATQKSENANEYEIQWGDTLWALSQATGISVSDLAAYNNIVNPDLIYADDHLAGVLSDLKDSTKTVEEVRAEVESVLEKETVEENTVEELAEAVEEEAEEVEETEEVAPEEETEPEAEAEEIVEVEEEPAVEEDPAEEPLEEEQEEAVEEVVEAEETTEEITEETVEEEIVEEVPAEEEETTEEAPVEETPEEENAEEDAAAPAEESTEETVEEEPAEEVEEETAETETVEEPTEEVVEEATEELPEEEVAAEEPAEKPQTENKQETVDPLFTDESMEPQDNIETEQSDEVVVEPESQVGTPQNFIIPAEGSITSGYGYRKSPLTGENKLHAGIDIAGGGLVVAAQGGTVVKSEYHEGWGNYVKIDHGNGVETLYAHMQDDSVMVSEGDVIDQGAHLGIMGTTGASTGVHLHFEVHINGVQVDPAPYLYVNV